MSDPWVEFFLEWNSEKVAGPPGRWRRVYREGDVRAVLNWAAEGLRERRRLEDLLHECGQAHGTAKLLRRSQDA